MKTEQEQRRAIRQILFDANDICQSTPCENEYCIYHGDYRCYDNVIVDKLIKAGYGDVSEYKAEIEDLKDEIIYLERKIAIRDNALKDSDKAIEMLEGKQDAIVKQAQIDVLNKVKDIVFDYLGVKNIKEAEALSLLDSTLTYDVVTCGIDEIIKEVENDK